MANQNRTRQKGMPDTGLHQHGESFFAYFACRYKKVGRSSCAAASEIILLSFNQAKKSISRQPRSGVRNKEENHGAAASEINLNPKIKN